MAIFHIVIIMANINCGKKHPTQSSGKNAHSKRDIFGTLQIYSENWDTRKKVYKLQAFAIHITMYVEL